MIEFLQDRKVRIKVFEDNFPLFFAYHFGWKFTKFQRDWMKSMQHDQNTMIVAMRASRKTTIVRGFVLRCIVYKKEPSIIVQSFEQQLSSDWVREVAKMLFKKTIREDYGLLFPLKTKMDDLKKKSLSNFEATNGVRIASKSLGQTLRGANSFDMDDEKSSRPTLLILDDIDVDKSVQNPDVIEHNYNKITGETISALDPLRRKIIFLGNVILEDGVVPRFYNEKKESKLWKCYRQALFDDNGENVRPEVFTESVVETIKDDGEISYNQNYLLIPYKNGDRIITRDLIQVTDEYPTDKIKFYIGIDPAFSLKTNTDAVGITVSGRSGDDVYIVESIGLEGKDKDENNIVKEVKKFYDYYNVKMIFVESQNGGEIIARMLQNAGMAVKVLHSDRDKVTRLSEHQGRFTRRQVFFLTKTKQLQDQLILFPSKAKDDMVDSMVFSFPPPGKKKKIEIHDDRSM